MKLTNVNEFKMATLASLLPKTFSIHQGNLFVTTHEYVDRVDNCPCGGECSGAHYDYYLPLCLTGDAKIVDRSMPVTVVNVVEIRYDHSEGHV